MVKFGKQIARHKTIVLLLCGLLMIPAFFGFVNTRVNYDLLSYLPKNLETVQGQDILVDEFGMGAFSMVIVEGMDNEQVLTLKEDLKGVEHVHDVLWIDDLADLSIPKDMLPDKISDIFYSGDSTLLVALFDNTTSSDETMQAISQMRQIAGKQCFISGMSGIVTDIKDLSLQEMPIYVVIAAVLCLVVLGLTMESLFVPVLFLLSIGVAILYNLGSNIFLGEISYITQALSAVLQLGVTMDYSIFLLNSYEENTKRFNGDKTRAMAHAISNTFKSVAGSSVTTIAGFAALCCMTFALGRDIGIVMAKGVVIGVLCCVILLPALILQFDGLIEKTKHKILVPNLDKISRFITGHKGIFIALFLVLLVPALYGNNHTAVYYNIDKSLPQDLDSAVANNKLNETFNMNNVHMLLMKNGLSSSEKEEMLNEIKQVDGVAWVLGLNTLIGPAIPEDMLPSNMTEMLKSDEYEIAFVCSDYKTATPEVNTQITQIQDIVKSYSPDSMVIGEAPLTKDLEDVTDIDLRNVNILSIAAIFIIIAIVFKSISLPIILVAVIEFAICVNMAVPFYTGTELPFVASIVIGTIQLGATVDYAILMTSRYQKERSSGKDKKAAILTAHTLSMKSILISGLTFFAATFGVCMYSEIDMISSICTLLARGAVVSTLVVICILPAMLLIFDKLIIKTSYHFLNNGKK